MLRPKGEIKEKQASDSIITALEPEWRLNKYILGTFQPLVVSPSLMVADVTARIDGDRRPGQLQHHSAQLLLSGALEQLLGLETLSAKISASSPSTIDVPDFQVSGSDLGQVGRQVNQEEALGRA